MTNDPFGGLNNLMKGLSGFMPQDDPEVKLLKAQSELSELQNQEAAIYAEIGRLALARLKDQYPEQEKRLQLIQLNIEDMRTKLEAAQKEKKYCEQAKDLAEQNCTCPQCGYHNPEDVKFCQECGAKLGIVRCQACGSQLALHTRFCGACGAKQED